MCGQVRARVATILELVKRAENDPSQVSLSVLRVYSKKLDTFHSEFLALQEEILSMNPFAKIEDSEFETLYAQARLGVEHLVEMLVNPPIKSPPVPSLSAEQQQSVQVHLDLKDQCCIPERCDTDHPPVNRSQSESSQSSPLLKSDPPSVKVHFAVPFGAKFHSCELCDEGHHNFQCPGFRKLYVPKRLLKIRVPRVCFNCFHRGHRSIDCPSKETRKSPVPQPKPESCQTRFLPTSSDVQTSCDPSLQSTDTVESAPLSDALSTVDAVPNLIVESIPSVLGTAFLDGESQTCSPVDSMCEVRGLEGRPVKDEHVGVADLPSKVACLLSENPRLQCTEYKPSLNCWSNPSGVRSADSSSNPLANDEFVAIIDIQQVSVVVVEVESPSAFAKDVCVVFCRAPEPKPPDPYTTDLPPSSTRDLCALEPKPPDPSKTDLPPISTGDLCVLEPKPPDPCNTDLPPSLPGNLCVFELKSVDPQVYDIPKRSSIPMMLTMPEPGVTVTPFLPRKPGVTEMPFPMEKPRVPRKPGVPETPFQPRSRMPKQPSVPKAPFFPKKSGVSKTPSTPREVPPNLNIPKVNIRKLMTNEPKKSGVPKTPITPTKSDEPMMSTLPEARCPVCRGLPGTCRGGCSRQREVFCDKSGSPVRVGSTARAPTEFESTTRRRQRNGAQR